MRGLPPPPSDVVRLSVTWEILGIQPSSSWWIRIPFWESLGLPELVDLFASMLDPIAAITTDLMHHHSLLSELRLRTYDPRTFNLVSSPAEIFGTWEFAYPDNVATCIHWMTGVQGKGRQAVTHLPGSPDALSNNLRTVRASFAETVLETANNLLVHINALTTSRDDHLELGTLHRSRFGVPLTEAEFNPFFGVLATSKVGTMRSRLPDSSSFSPG